MLKPNDNDARMINDINHYVLNITRASGLPYFDSALPFRVDLVGTSRKCHLIDSDINTKMWVDIMRAKIFLNHVCDDDMNWIGSTDRFVHAPSHP